MTDLAADGCPGPFLWVEAPGCDVILECAACRLVVIGSGALLPRDHIDTPLLREGMPS